MTTAQLYIITPHISQASESFAPLDLMTRTLPGGAVRLCLKPDHSPSIVTDLRDIVQNRNLALLIEDDIEFAARSNADGVRLSNHLSVQAARLRLGEHANIGANCYASRHAAMEAGEQGADYVAFGPGHAGPEPGAAGGAGIRCRYDGRPSGLGRPQDHGGHRLCSPHIVNFQVGYDNPRWKTQATLLYNVSSKRIVSAGLLGTPDKYEQPFHQLDFVFSQNLYKGLSMQASAQNILDDDVLILQGDEISRQFRRGRFFNLSVRLAY